MPKVLDAESTLTNRYQTTIPGNIRSVLNLKKQDKIGYSVDGKGNVVLSRVCIDDHSDPALESFLDFLAHDISAHPERLQAFDAGLLKRLNDLVGDVEVDLDAPLSEDDE